MFLSKPWTLLIFQEVFILCTVRESKYKGKTERSLCLGGELCGNTQKA